MPSAGRTVQFLVKERILDETDGQVKSVPPPEQETWHVLNRNEYDMFEELQPRDETSTTDYTFRWQPTRERLPLFKDVGIYELWFRFVAENSNLDDIRLIYEVFVGNPSGPRRT